MWNQIQKRFSSTESFISLILGLAVVLLIGTLIFNYVRGKQQALVQKAEGDKKQEQAAQLPTTYTVAEGDTLWGVSEKNYKTGYNWPDIQKANNLTNADYLEVGQLLTIPVVTPIMPREGQIAATSVEVKTEKTYTAVRGDTLWDIAQNHYGSGFRWVDIAKANQLTNPDLIHAGNVFTLP